MTKEEVLQHDKKFRYMLLSRMQSDCEYYLNYGNRNPKRLWAGDEQRQIEYMILLHDSFKEDEKPQGFRLMKFLITKRECLSLLLDMRDAAAASITVAAFDDDFSLLQIPFIISWLRHQEFCGEIVHLFYLF